MTAFTFDTKDPTQSQPMFVVATTTPASLNFFTADDSSLEMMISLDPGYAGASWQPYASNASTTLVSDPDTVYVRFKDYYNNYIDANATTPETPLNIIIRDVSNTNAGDYRLFVAWREVSTPLPDFEAYYVYYSLAGVNYAPLTGITDRAENYFIHFNLSSSDTFYYKVASGDTDGNYSYFSYPVVSSSNYISMIQIKSSNITYGRR